jgi:hypothetical protein
MIKELSGSMGGLCSWNSRDYIRKDSHEGTKSAKRKRKFFTTKHTNQHERI